MSEQNTPDDLFLDLDALPDVPDEEDRPPTPEDPLPKTETDNVVQLDVAGQPEEEPAVAEQFIDPFAFDLPTLDEALVADGLLPDGVEIGGQEAEATAPENELLHDQQATVPEEQLSPGAEQSALVEASTDAEVDGSVAADAVPQAEVERSESEVAPAPALDAPVVPTLIPDPAAPVRVAGARRTRLLWLVGASLAAAAALGLFWALPLDKKSAAPLPEVAESPSVETPPPGPEQDLQTQPEEVAPVDLAATVPVAAEPDLTPEADQQQAPATTPEPEAKAAAPVPKRVAAKPTPTPSPRTNSVPKQPDEQRGWQDDALDSLDEFEKRL